jgi:hypothetical protein
MNRRTFIIAIIAICSNAIAGPDPMLINDFNSESREQYQNQWRLIEDGVMGGQSSGVMEWTQIGGRSCLRLNGTVSTKNNGGFIQVQRPIDEQMASIAGDFRGIEIDVIGNNESYNIHLKQKGLIFPWQSFRANLFATDKWQTIQLPFSAFRPYRTGKRLEPQKINQIALLAIGKDYVADICLARVALYR